MYGIYVYKICIYILYTCIYVYRRSIFIYVVYGEQRYIMHIYGIRIANALYVCIYIYML